MLQPSFEDDVVNTGLVHLRFGSDGGGGLDVEVRVGVGLFVGVAVKVRVGVGVRVAVGDVVGGRIGLSLLQS